MLREQGHAERHPPSSRRLDDARIDQTTTVLLSIVVGDSHALRNLAHPARTVILRHGAQERNILTREGGERRGTNVTLEVLT